MPEFTDLPPEFQKAVKTQLHAVFTVFGGVPPEYFDRLQKLLCEIAHQSSTEPFHMEHPIPPIIQEYFQEDANKK